eukprot:2885687-Pyramimonas_sp.AAC.1
MRGPANLASAVGRRGLAAEGCDCIDGAQADLAGPQVIACFRQRIATRQLCGLQFGFDCKTWSRARNNDGLGPPPLRSDDCQFGLPSLSTADLSKVSEANLILSRVLSLVEAAASAGRVVMIENSTSSRLWLVPQHLELVTRFNA